MVFLGTFVTSQASATHRWESNNGFNYIIIGNQVYSYWVDAYGYRYFFRVENPTSTANNQKDLKKRLETAVENSKKWNEVVRKENSEAVKRNLSQTLSAKIQANTVDYYKVKSVSNLQNAITESHEFPMDAVNALKIMANHNVNLKNQIKAILVSDFISQPCYKFLSFNICSAYDLVVAVTYRPINLAPLKANSVGYALLKKAAIKAQKDREPILGSLKSKIDSLQSASNQLN